MKLILGFLAGIFVVMLVLATLSYIEYKQPIDKNQRANFVEKARVEVKPQAIILSQPSSTLKVKKNKLFKWKDVNGQLVIGSNPPAGVQAKPYIPQSNITVVDFVEVKSNNIKQNDKSEDVKRSVVIDSNVTKTTLLAENHTHCRWLVGRAKDVYDKILNNNTSRPSIWCDEHKKWKKEMQKLEIEGDSCYYPYQTPSTCYQ